MTDKLTWWNGLSKGQKLLVGIVGTAAVIATGGAVAYAVAAHGAVVVTVGGTVVAVGKVAKRVFG